MLTQSKIIALLMFWVFSFPLHHSDAKESTSRVEKQGDIMLGSLFAIHKEGAQEGSCAEVNPVTGVIFHEAFQYAIRKLNKGNKALYGASLGYTTIDTCSSSTRLKGYLKGIILKFGGVGIVGPLTSEEAVYSSPVLSIFDLNMISYYSSSTSINQRQRYDNMYRTVPSDSKQMQAIIDIVRARHWTYLAVIYSSGNYGQQGTQYFTERAESYGLCLLRPLLLTSKPSKGEYESVIQTLLKDSKIKVVVIITTVLDTKGLLEANRRLRVRPGRFIWIGSTSWGTEQSVTENLEQEAEGAIIVAYKTEPYHEFMEYLWNLNVKNVSSPWTRELLETLYNCSTENSTHVRKCSGQERLGDAIYRKYSIPVGLVFQAVNTFACVLRKVINTRCPGPELNKTLCIFAPPPLLSPYQFSEKLQLKTLLRAGGSQCTEVPNSVPFEEDGSVKGEFNILSFRKINGKYQYITIGHWRALKGASSNQSSSPLSLNQTKLLEQDGYITPTSSCSRPCAANEIIIPDRARQRCCWSCLKCGDKDIVVNKSTCLTCPSYQFPNVERSQCNELPVLKLKFSHALVVSIIAFSLAGVLSVATVTYIFVANRKRQLVRASSRELSLLILFGLLLCFLTPLSLLVEAGNFICGVRFLLYGLSSTTCFMPLLLKTMRIYRIFTAAKKSIKRPILISPRSQVSICMGLLIMQLFLGITWLLSDKTTIERRTVNQNTEMIKFCTNDSSPIIFNYVTALTLVILCTYYAFRTRNFPKNYNEAKSIGITLYVTCILLGTFIPIFVSVRSDEDAIKRKMISGIYLELLASVNLIGLFGPKIYFLVCRGDVRPDTSTLYSQPGQVPVPGGNSGKVEPLTSKNPVSPKAVSRTTSTSDLYS